jgi:hypothetical protein
MRYRIAAALVSLSLLPRTAAADDIPMMAIGLPFAPESPAPVSADHQLYQQIDVDEIIGLPATVKSSSLNWIAAAKRSSINEALAASLRRMNMLAPDAATAKTRLIVTWRGIEPPVRGRRHAATVTLHYRLLRVSNGEQLFEREVTTSAEGSGVDLAMLENGLARAAIAANFASIAYCLDRAPSGTAPANCALTPRFSVNVSRR